MPQTNMVNGQVITVGITDHSLIAAMLAVPRRIFVPSAMQSISHIDANLKLKEGSLLSPPRYLMSAGPFAKLVQAAKIRRKDTVLDVGCATGYSSAVLARLAEFVIGLESDGQLAASASTTLANLGIDNVAIVTGPLEVGWPEEAPYDVIFIGGSVERIPSALITQLRDGGRLVTIMGSGYSASAYLYIKSGSGFSGRKIFNVAAQPLPGFAVPKVFVF